jgi:hypothetical protein
LVGTETLIVGTTAVGLAITIAVGEIVTVGVVEGSGVRLGVAVIDGVRGAVGDAVDVSAHMGVAMHGPRACCVP